MHSLWTPRISHHLMDHAMNQSTHQFHKIFFHVSMFSMQCRKNIAVEDNKKKKEKNITNFINITLYIPVLNMWGKWLKIKMILKI